MDSSSQKKYWAFISYSSKDKKWGQWLHKRLERYPIPKELQGAKLFDGAVLGKNLRPVFRDRDELAGSANLGPALEAALRESRYLVVLCSKNSAQSTWVDKEIEDFKSMGGEKNILALILDGEPNSGGADECFPPSLRYPTEPLAGDLRKDGDGKERGFLKIVAGAAQLDFDALYRRHERAQRKKRLIFGTIAMSVIAALAGLSIFALQQRSEARQNAKAATSAQAQAETNEQRATELLVSNYVERGRQNFIDGTGAESLAFFNEARKIDPKVPGINRMTADAWRELSPLKEEIQGERKRITQLFFSSNGTTLAAQNSHGGIRKFELDPATLTLASHQFISFMPHPLIFSSSPYLTGYFEQTDPENPNSLRREIRRVDWHGEAAPASIPWPKDQSRPSLIVASPAGNLAATYTDHYGDQANDSVQLWKFEDAKISKSQFNLPESPNNFRWFYSADEQTLAQLKYSGSTFDITFRESSSGKILQQFPLNSRPETQTTFANRICIGLNNGEIIEFQRDQKITRRSPAAGTINQLGTLQYSSDGKQLLAGGAMGNVVLYDTADLSVTLQINRQQIDGVIQHASLSKSGRFIAVAHAKQVSVFNTESSELHGRFSWTGAESSCSTFSADDTLLAVGTDSGNIRVWGLEKQEPWHREYQSAEETSLTLISHLQDDQYLIRGNKTHLLNLAAATTSELSSTKGPVAALSPDQELLELGDSLISLSIQNAKTEKLLQTPWNTGARNTFLTSGSRAAGVIIQKDGLVQAYSSAPEFLPEKHQAKQIKGDPQSIVNEPGHPVICASFTDGNILEFGVGDTGIQHPQLHRLPNSEKAPPVLHQLRNDHLLLSILGQMSIYHLKTKSLIKIPRLGLSGGTFFTKQEQLCILTIDAFGQLETWNDQAQLLANAPSPIQKASNLSLLGGRKTAGTSILLNQDSDTAYTTFGSQLYIWSLPDLALLWRSPEISPIGELLTLRRVTESENQIVLTEHNFANNTTFGKIHIINPPAVVPSIEELDSYLSTAARIKISEGRIIRN